MHRFCALFLTAGSLLLCQAQTYPGLIGTGVDGGQEGARSRMFVDMGRTFRPATLLAGGETAPVDANGWPSSDFQTVIFDARPFGAWLSPPQYDDPERRQPDFGGVYSISFTGQATVESRGDPVTLSLTYNANTNVSSGTMTVPPATGLLILGFRDTRRTAASATGSGITGLSILRPGYPAGTTQLFTNEFLAMIRPFRVLRLMGFSGTNSQEDAFTYPNQRSWSDRHVPADATQQGYGGKEGVAWEYAARLANESGKDIWINVPVSASDDYVRQLATLMRNTLKPGLRLYVEHSNEVWNPLFKGHNWNRDAATADPAVKINPGSNSIDVWKVRRHLKRLIEVSNIFREAFGDSGHRIIRPVFSWWNLKTGEYRNALEWAQNHFGVAPNTLIWGLAQTHYFNDERSQQSTNATVDQVLADMRANSDAGVPTSRELHTIAQTFGIAHVTYEAGPDNGGGSTNSIGNRILANRDPRMKDLLIYDVRNNWFGLGENYGLYMNLEVASGYSRHGSWGLTEDAAVLNTPKYQAAQELIGPVAAPTVQGLADAASGRNWVVAGAFLSIYGHGFVSGESWWSAAPDGSLPQELAGLRVLVNGKLAYINYAGPGQVNVLLPQELSGNSVSVELIGPGGVSSGQVTVAPVAPAFFGYLLGGKFYPSAVFANSGGIYVAAAGALPTVTSRPAKAGDFLELYVSGLPLPAGTPAGKVIETPIPIDASRLRVTIDGVQAAVPWAGLRYAGVFQVNVQVPQLSRAGEAPIVLTVDGQSTQTALLAVE